MAEDQTVEQPDPGEYETPVVEDLDTAEGPSVTAAGETIQPPN